MSQREKRREEREKEIGMLRKGQCVYRAFFLNARKLRKLRHVVLISLSLMSLMFISGYLGLKQVTHDAQRRESGGATQPTLNMRMY